MTQSEMSKKCYERRKDSGLCPRCGKVLDRKGYYCVECLSKANEEQRKTREFCKKMQICPVCRKSKLFGNESQCISCRQKHYEYSMENPLTDEQKKKYVEHVKIHQKELYRARVANGICTRCGKFKSKEGRKKCPICLEKDAHVHRQRYKNKMIVKESD